MVRSHVPTAQRLQDSPTPALLPMRSSSFRSNGSACVRAGRGAAGAMCVWGTCPVDMCVCKMPHRGQRRPPSQPSPIRTECGPWSPASPQGTFRAGAWPWLSPTRECPDELCFGSRRPRQSREAALQTLEQRCQGSQARDESGWPVLRGAMCRWGAQCSSEASRLGHAEGDSKWRRLQLCRAQSEHCVVR